MNLASTIYAGAARARRRWYARHAEARRRLARPVISVGNISAGGSGKTPVAAFVAHLLLALGERPSILTRGYARRTPSDGVTVVSDGQRELAGVDRAGDEPLMLARQLPGVPVFVSADRFLAGCLAERRFGCTVHVLDDGFQHFQLERDVDLVLISPDDISHPVTLPSGRLREPLDAARAADAVIVSDADEAAAMSVGRTLSAAHVFRLTRRLGIPQFVEPPAGMDGSPGPGTRVLGVAGLARPERFFAALAAERWVVADTMAFADHHAFTATDVRRIAGAMSQAGAAIVMTTEKDLMRLLPLCPLPVPVAWVPLEVSVEPAAEFSAWLRGHVGH
ncbi:MAG TPA: tetraacyldisaccharide 4'-kinase [Vicinamibacterales bacterium]